MSIDTSSVSAEAVAGYSQIGGARRDVHDWLGSASF